MSIEPLHIITKGMLAMRQLLGFENTTCPAIYAAMLLDTARNMGIDVEKILKPLNMEHRSLQRLDAYITHLEMAEIVNALYQHSGNPALGLEYATRIDPFRAGVLGQALMTAPDLKTACTRGFRYAPAYDMGVAGWISESASVCAIHLKFAWLKLAPKHLSYFYIEQNLGTYLSVARYYLGSTQAVQSIQLAVPAPDHYESYRRYFDCEINFNAEDNVILVDKEAFYAPFPRFNATVSNAVIEQCEAALAAVKSQQRWTTRVMEILKNSDNESLPDIETTAALLAISSRSLRRRLDREGVCFQDLILRRKADLARHYLLNSEQSVEAIALQLGFSDASSFRKFFRKQFGTTPAQYRSQTPVIHRNDI